MANVFTQSNEATKKPNRNTFPLSFTNNLTLKLGTLTPFCAIETLPGDSFSIDPSIGFDMQPMVHPVQTNLRADVHFFYVPNRALWDGWKNFIGNIDSPDESATMKVPPYISWQNQSKTNVTSLKSGDIADYLGVPTEVFTSNSNFALDYECGPIYDYNEDNEPIISYLPTYIHSLYNVLNKTSSQVSWAESSRNGFFGTFFANDKNLYISTEDKLFTHTSDPSICMIRSIPRNTRAIAYNAQVYQYLSRYNLYSITDDSTGEDVDTRNTLLCVVQKDTGTVVSYRYIIYDADSSSYEVKSGYNSSNVEVNGNITGGLVIPNDDTYDGEYLFIVLNIGYYDKQNAPSFSNISYANSAFVIDSSYGVEASSLPLEQLPYRSAANPNGIPISALPYRAYEAIYNSFYRDERNNPRKVDGRPVYNTFLPTKDGGADTTHYKLYQRNWEQDFLTTSVQSPQQGVAPLVGVTGSGLMTFQDENGVSYTMQATVGEDGETITGISSYSSDMPSGTLRAMVDTISAGISINDFRNVNAFQRWLETNMRKGLRYKDQIEAHFGVSPTYSELDLPIFIGGFSRDVDTTAVSQTSQDTSTSALGTKAGQAHVVGSSKVPIKHFCEEHGWIIGIISITPKPVYSQLLNKSLFKSNLLDYFSPEFGHMPYQPILNQEVAPLLCTDEEGKRLTDVFGYQRAWYEYLERQDEAHGDYRSTMRRYLINRLFTGLPQLGNEFLTISQDEANDVFAVTDPNLSKIFGQVHLDIMAKRPIPRLGIPKLEVE